MADTTPHASELRKLGVFNPAMLAGLASAKRSHLIEGVILRPSTNVLIGDSGLGKTAFAIQLGISIAAGVPWLGRRVEKGPVLYLDAESPAGEFHQIVTTISRFLGLNDAPHDFYAWSPNWDPRPANEIRSLNYIDESIKEQIEKLRPVLVIVDALRDFWPRVEEKQSEAVTVFNFQRGLSRRFDTSWLNIHHIRKGSSLAPTPSLEDNPHSWFLEAAGARAIINQSDTRLGITQTSQSEADLVIAGFTRVVGKVPPTRIQRVIDENGDPLGYRALMGLDHLSPRQREAFLALPERFRFSDAQKALGGNSASNVKAFLELCVALQLVRKETDKSAPYVKRGVNSKLPLSN